MEDYEMTMVSPGKYRFQFPEDSELPIPLEYKYTRGGWNQVELDKLGKPYGNRVIPKPEGIIKDIVIRWQMDITKKVSLAPIAEVLSETFEIPQLKKKRRVHVLLPHDYYEKPEVRYPVLYMTDAQNLFGEGSPYGNWEIDKSLEELAKENHADVIIVAIEHGGEDRITEFSPYDNPRLGKGLGSLFLRFVAETLKPHVDANYRTKPDRLNTGMGGSSVGGLLSIYAALMFPHVFGRLMIFSPSLWISQKVYFDAIHFFEPFETRIYLYAGGKEGANMLPNFEKFHKTLANQGFGYSRVKIKSSIDPIGEHTETQWSKEFPIALKWLFFGE
ncbi:alpha/beta hydrolase [Dyadobacter sp. CY326]|uniref:alpha/beta hydrolase n=1 Tax=Dyadobacter sp. CY326 TaxID=2907300 RepID=UPI001EEA3B08|nr:alpha/beta hydrolase-fold protein [Dyadobacter sp. CY326]MCE7065585.1 carbohydrate esterase [Dyadobacter sp. CY326]